MSTPISTNDVFELLGRLAVTTAAYPIEYVKVLMQLGHEPIPPRPGYTWTGRPCNILPGCYEYLKHVRTTDGFTGLYRGLVPKLCCTMVSGAVYSGLMGVGLKDWSAEKSKKIGHDPEIPTVQRYGDTEGSSEEIEECPEESLTLQQFLRKMFRNSLCRALAIAASHPFHVISIRKMAEFIGREEIYGGLWSSTVAIYQENGVLGFFQGLAPRMIADLVTLWISGVGAYLVNKYVLKEKNMKGYVNASMVYIASALTYPLNLTSNIMSVNNSGLMAGSPPYSPHYDNWVDCWRHLSITGQLKRGSSIIWRYQTGPVVITQPSLLQPHKPNDKRKKE